MNLSSEIFSLVGASLVLVAYFGLQIGWMKSRSFLYLNLNLAGVSILLVTAWWGRQIGFILLQAAWLVITAKSLIEKLRSKGAPDA